MIVGIDFDNTIVCYDGLFHQAAVARELIPVETSPTKEVVRDLLRATGREAAWTELQGQVYGHQIQRARCFEGIESFLQRCCEQGVTVHVISHRTRQPFAGPAIDMHDAARGWLEAQGWFSGTTSGLDGDRVHFEETKSAKLARIAAVKCDVFIDDLPELLALPEFPVGVRRILFDPHASSTIGSEWSRAASWREITTLIFDPELS